ncbi:MAG: ThuA domain-containing protein [Verrucomicrobia bacterium]|nr:ThuA domain-containing protein [Verrucomicrobiota bacterium]
MKLLALLPLLLVSLAAAATPAKVRVLIIDGQNNHTVWPKSTAMMKAYFEQSGRFEVAVARTQYTWKGDKWLAQYPLVDGRTYQDQKEPQPDPTFAPDFSKYDVVVSNFGWKAADWPEATQQALEKFVSRGGGFVSVHAANNSFPGWKAYNRMIGLGGWGGRNEKDGPYVYYDKAGKLVRDPSPGPGGAHGPQHEYVVEARQPDHPILRGLPRRWRHTQDECYDRLRGPAENLTVLATAYSSPEFKGTDRHEPALMVIEFGQGRVFHTILGHEDYSFESVGFITTLLRGTEWAATGRVTLPVPPDFPTENQNRRRPFTRP